MAPARKHDTDMILDAARALVLRDGPRAASVAAIARASGAPVGTLYHRFGSRDGVLEAAWLRALESFQRRALEAAANADPLKAAVAMAVSPIGFARERPQDARLLLTLRRQDLLDADADDAFRTRLQAINAPLEAAVAELARALRGRADARAVDAVTRAVVDLPTAAIRRYAGDGHARDGRYVRTGGGLPLWLERDIAEAARRLLQP
jgi:AcrR family transcriptional regulator